MWESIFGYKASVVLGVVLMGLFRLIRVKSKAKTFWGRVIDSLLIFCLSIFCGLALLPFAMSMGVPPSGEVICAMGLALCSESVISKILDAVRGFDLKQALHDYISKHLK
ncbi:hypothetical protein [Ketogulonicigenium vulgare]|uniref:hypothetical protein n=1 Tax=Ketogulonicigenium vulgare TaxID=92945 RepID=UPI002358C78A|nr:hypothetical protein [Ketogulonicigenium vulgare]